MGYSALILLALLAQTLLNHEGISQEAAPLKIFVYPELLISYDILHMLLSQLLSQDLI